MPLVGFRGAHFDRRGTLAVTSDEEHRVAAALRRLGRPAGPDDVFTLSVELGVQKPDPRMLTYTLERLGIGPEEALVVGDRSRPDGGAVDPGPQRSWSVGRTSTSLTATCGGWHTT